MGEIVTLRCLSLRCLSLRCLSLLFVLLVLANGCGGGGGGGSNTRSAFTLVQTIPVSGIGFLHSIGLDRSGAIYAGTLFEEGARGGVTRYVRQSSGEFVGSRLVEGASGSPIAVSWGSGRIFTMADRPQRQIEIYDPRGPLLKSIPFPIGASDIRVSNAGDVFVLSGGIVRLDEQGNQTGSFPLGQSFYGVVRLATDNEGNVAVLGQEDPQGGAAQPIKLRVYSPQGVLLREQPLLDESGSVFTELDLHGMTISPDGKLYITQGSGINRMQVFNYQTGKWLAKQTNIFDSVQDVAVDSSGTVYILGNEKVYVYRPTP
jgi:hypothetical protein